MNKSKQTIFQDKARSLLERIKTSSTAEASEMQKGGNKLESALSPSEAQEAKQRLEENIKQEAIVAKREGEKMNEDAEKNPDLNIKDKKEIGGEVEESSKKIDQVVEDSQEKLDKVLPEGVDKDIKEKFAKQGETLDEAAKRIQELLELAKAKKIGEQPPSTGEYSEEEKKAGAALASGILNLANRKKEQIKEEIGKELVKESERRKKIDGIIQGCQEEWKKLRQAFEDFGSEVNDAKAKEAESLRSQAVSLINTFKGSIAETYGVDSFDGVVPTDKIKRFLNELTTLEQKIAYRWREVQEINITAKYQEKLNGIKEDFAAAQQMRGDEALKALQELGGGMIDFLNGLTEGIEEIYHCEFDKAPVLVFKNVKDLLEEAKGLGGEISKAEKEKQQEKVWQTVAQELQSKIKAKESEAEKSKEEKTFSEQIQEIDAEIEKLKEKDQKKAEEYENSAGYKKQFQENQLPIEVLEAEKALLIKQTDLLDVNEELKQLDEKKAQSQELTKIEKKDYAIQRKAKERIEKELPKLEKKLQVLEIKQEVRTLTHRLIQEGAVMSDEERKTIQEKEQQIRDLKKELGEKKITSKYEKEIHKQIAWNLINIPLRILGLKSIPDIARWCYQRKKLKGKVWSKFRPESAKGGLKGSVENLLHVYLGETAEKRKESSPELKSYWETSFPDKAETLAETLFENKSLQLALKDFNRRLKSSKEGVTKNSEARKKLVKLIRDYRSNIETGGSMETSQELGKIVQDYLTTKVTGMEVIREGLNTALTAFTLPAVPLGASYPLTRLARGLSYYGFRLAEKAVQENKLQRQRAEKVNFWHNIVVALARMVGETYRGILMREGEQKKGKLEKGLDFSRALSSILTFFGIAPTMVSSWGSYKESFSHILDGLSERQAWGESVRHIPYNFIANPIRIVRQYQHLGHPVGHLYDWAKHLFGGENEDVIPPAPVVLEERFSHLKNQMGGRWLAPEAENPKIGGHWESQKAHFVVAQITNNQGKPDSLKIPLESKNQTAFQALEDYLKKENITPEQVHRVEIVDDKVAGTAKFVPSTAAEVPTTEVPPVTKGLVAEVEAAAEQKGGVAAATEGGPIETAGIESRQALNTETANVISRINKSQDNYIETHDKIFRGNEVVFYDNNGVEISRHTVEQGDNLWNIIKAQDDKDQIATLNIEKGVAPFEVSDLQPQEPALTKEQAEGLAEIQKQVQYEEPTAEGMEGMVTPPSPAPAEITTETEIPAEQSVEVTPTAKGSSTVPEVEPTVTAETAPETQTRGLEGVETIQSQTELPPDGSLDKTAFEKLPTTTVVYDGGSAEKPGELREIYKGLQENEYWIKSSETGERYVPASKMSFDYEIDNTKANSYCYANEKTGQVFNYAGDVWEEIRYDSKSKSLDFGAFFATEADKMVEQAAKDPILNELITPGKGIYKELLLLSEETNAKKKEALLETIKTYLNDYKAKNTHTDDEIRRSLSFMLSQRAKTEDVMTFLEKTITEASEMRGKKDSLRAVELDQYIKDLVKQKDKLSPVELEKIGAKLKLLARLFTAKTEAKNALAMQEILKKSY